MKSQMSANELLKCTLRSFRVQEYQTEICPLFPRPLAVERQLERRRG